MFYFFQDVRNEHNVPVDMRIGVHSGFILSGIIGKTLMLGISWYWNVVVFTNILQHFNTVGKGVSYLPILSCFCILINNPL